MSFANSRQTLVANVAQQIGAVATLLVLPNVLTTAAFAEIVYVGMLLSFISIADVGLNYVYCRLVPTLSSRGETKAIAQWDYTVRSFGLLTSLVFGLVVSLIHFAKFHSPLHSLLFYPVAPLSFLASFHVVRISCFGDFLSYRRMVVVRALMAVGILPLAYLWGVTGWFIGALLSAIMLLSYISKVSWVSAFAIDWHLIRNYVGEGLLRCGITVLWLQLLTVGRLYASSHYSYATIAEYGLATSACQSLSALVLAAFLPISVETLRRYGSNAEDAMQYVHKIAERVSPWSLLGTIVVAELSPLLLRWFFPGYHLDSTMVASMVSGVLFYPFFIMWGNCFIGARCFGAYIAVIMVGLATAWSVATYFGSDPRGAAIGQFLGLMMFSFAMYLVAPVVLKAPAKLWLRSFLLFTLTAGTGVVYWVLRWM